MAILVAGTPPPAASPKVKPRSLDGSSTPQSASQRRSLATLVRNRVRHSEKKQLARFNKAVKMLPDALGLRLTRDLPERVGFRELYPFGLTHADCRDLPDMAGVKISSTADMDALLEELGILDTGEPLFSHLTNKALRQVSMPARTMARHRNALRQQLGPTPRALTRA